MRLMALLFTAILVGAPVRAQQPPASVPQDERTKEQGQSKDQELNLPVSLEKIKEQLQQPTVLQIHTPDERATFRVQILEKQKIEELIASLKFKDAPIPAGGVEMQELQRIWFNPVDNPLVQPLAAFNQGELLTILIENLVGKYLGGKALNAMSKAERAHAEAAAREEVRAAIEQYCNAQPNAGAGLALCASLGR
jgi:ribosomal protein L12E/L44/L45/RPP1/RPP2